MTTIPDAEPARPAKQHTRLLRSFPRGPLAAFCIAYLAVVTFASVAAPLLAPYNPLATDLGAVLSGPTAAHPFGTDSLGRDVLSRMMYGGQVSLAGVAEAVLAVVVVGVPLGLLAGFFGGWFDRLVAWVTDLILAVPVVAILLVILGVFGNNHAAAMVALGLLGAPGLARVVRSATLAVRQELFIAAARISGLSDPKIIVRHVIPRVAGPVIVQASIFAGVALLIETGLGFLGLGMQPPTPTWGGLVADASAVIDRQPWMLVPTGAVIGLTILSFGLIGDAVRDATTQRTTRGPISRRGSRHRGLVAGATELRSQPDTAVGRSLLSLRDVTVELPSGAGTANVVESLDLDIRPGETVGLVGESGSGKSLTGRAILGLLPDGGRLSSDRIAFDGRELTAVGARALRRVRGREIALISQDPLSSLDPAMRVGDQVAELVRRHHGGTRNEARQRTIELLTSVRLSDPELVIRRYPHQLSGGMAQRVAIAMALSGRPKLLIADEPTTALDVTVQAEILDLLRGLVQETGMALLLISHDWGVIADICERAYVMYAGHVMESGPVLDLLEHQRHPYTVALLNSRPEHARRRQHLPVIPGTVPEPRDWPPGCRFHPRCALATGDCSSGRIPIRETVSGGFMRCVHDDLLAQGGEHD